MTIKFSWYWIRWIVGIALIVFLWMHVDVVPYKYNARCIDKMAVGDKYGQQILYHVVLKSDNGEIEELNINAENYYDYEVGALYNYEALKLVWK